MTVQFGDQYRALPYWIMPSGRMIKAVFVQSQAEKATGQDHSAVFSHLMKLTEKTKLDSS